MTACRIAAAALCLLALAGCRQEMAKQPVGRPLSGFSARPLEPGTLPRGALADSYEVRTGRRAGADPEVFAKDVFVAKVPVDVTAELVERGRQRYNVYCAVCHGRLGNGDGKIPERGFTKPPSYYDDLARGFKVRGIDLPLTEVPDGYLFDVITHGYGAMADYSTQVPVHDRWAIVTYIRALQKSQRPRPEDIKKLPEAEQQRLKAAEEKTE